MKASSISSEVGLAAQVQTVAKQAKKGSESPFTAREERSAWKKLPEPTSAHAEATEQALRISEPVINGLGLGLKFSLDTETGQKIITVYDLKTKQVIRQIPPDEVLAFLRQFQDNNGLAAGLFISRRL